MRQVLERQQHWLACSQYLPTDACPRWGHGGRRNADFQLDHAASGCSPGGVMSLLRHMATMDTLAALGWSICATGAGAASHVKAPARLVAQHQNPAKLRTVLALLSHGYLPYSVASDSKLLETSRGLGSGGPAASRVSRPAGGEWGRKYGTSAHIFSSQGLRDTILHPNLVVDHDSGLKNRCSPSRFREIAIDNLSLDGGSTSYSLK